MFKIGSEIELLNAFRPQDRRAIELPRGVKFPLFVRFYFRWTESSGHRIHLITGDPEGPLTGLTFRRDQRGDAPWWRMCEWCHSYGSSNEIGLLTVDVDGRRRIGVHVCLDLACIEKLEAEADRTGEDLRKMADRLLQRMDRFVEEVFYESTPHEAHRW